MYKNSVKSYFKIALLLSLAIGITIHFPMVMSYLFGEGEDTGRHADGFMVSFTHLGTELLITYIVALLMFTLNFFILKPVEKHGKLNIYRILLAVLLTVISVYILNHFLYDFKGETEIFRNVYMRAMTNIYVLVKF